MEPEVLLRQKHLNMTFFTVVLMIITTVQWITLDMYLPALPVLKEEFHTTESMLNISMNAGILSAAVGTLVSGTLSDRFGRKPVLLAGLLISAACNYLCVFAGGVLFLSVFRGIAGFGSGCAETVTAAMLKDSFTGRRFQKSMTVMQAIAALGPLFAPTLGSVLINFASWRAIFYFLGISTALTMIPILFSTETWPAEKRVAEKMSDVLREATSIMKAPAFALFLSIAALLTIPVWAYIAASPYVYINEFGIRNVEYGVFYGVGAGMSIAAPFLYLLLNRLTGSARVVSVTIGMALAAALSLLLIGSFHPVLFLFSIVPIMLAEGMIRPLSLVVLLDEYSHAAGSASAITHFILTLVGIVGTTLATLAWSSMITGVGIITAGCGLLALFCWLRMRRMELMRNRLNY